VTFQPTLREIYVDHRTGWHRHQDFSYLDLDKQYELAVAWYIDSPEDWGEITHPTYKWNLLAILAKGVDAIEFQREFKRLVVDSIRDTLTQEWNEQDRLWSDSDRDPTDTQYKPFHAEA
jgi:hypothetical protein